MSTRIVGDDSASPQGVAGRIARLSPQQRAALDRILAARTPQAETPAEPRNDAERELTRIWREVLRADKVGIHDSFFALGGDSISSLQISARAAAAGLRFTSRQVLEEETVARLAAVATRAARASVGADVAVGPTVLTPIQRWFFEQNLPDSHHWDQAVFVDVRGRIDEEPLRYALRALAAHHDVLRSRFIRRDGEWRQEVLDRAPDPACTVEDLSGIDAEARADALRAATLAAQARIDLAEGPLVSAVLFRWAGSEPDRLLLCVHHLVVDGVSMRILLEDLETAYRDARAGRPVALPDRTLSFRGWSGLLARHADSAQVRDELAYWREVPRAELAALPVAATGPVGDAPNTVDRARLASAVVPREVVAAVRRDVLRVPGVHVRDILLAAFLLAWREQTGREALQLDLEGHGREPLDEPVDVTRTVGWFTAMYPVVLRLLRHESGVAAVTAIARQLAAVPAKGFGYGLLRYLSGPVGAVLAELPQSQITFNYLGWFDRAGPETLLGPPLQVPGPLQSDAATRRHLIDVVVTGVGEELLVDLAYPGGLVADEDARRLVSRFVAYVAELVEEYRTGALAEGSRDFALMRVDARQMSAIARQIGT